eukprot:TRINITY_DN23172_c0_g2_i1.p1 TRINITY_DN23172_c0_g2~~TRINITY_DN23172_c0_g2_i1.p1  ORF type:complete len:835 (+),score=200.61 TRINITY_DN23172_c0_g2_i1:93-2507(+)
MAPLSQGRPRQGDMGDGFSSSEEDDISPRHRQNTLHIAADVHRQSSGKRSPLPSIAAPAAPQRYSIGVQAAFQDLASWVAEGQGAPSNDVAYLEATSAALGRASEDWRAEFPLEKLTALACFYEELPRAEDGSRLLDRDQLQSLVTEVLELPNDAAKDTASILRLEASRNSVVVYRCTDGFGSTLTCPARLAAVESPAMGERFSVPISSLLRFLELARAIDLLASQEHAALLLEPPDRRKLESVFRHRAGQADRMQVANLFPAIADLNLDGFDVDKADHQKLVADAMQATLRGRNDRASIFSKSPTFGTMSFDDFIRVLSLTVRARAREERKIEFGHERRAHQETGFDQDEVEDLRELHAAYLGFAAEAGDDTVSPLKSLASLLRLCGQRELDESDARGLRRIVRRVPPRTSPVTGATAPFDVFLLWMREVFASEIGGIKLKSQGDDEEVPQLPRPEKKSFVAALARERARFDELARSQREREEEEEQEQTFTYAKTLPAVPDSKRGSRVPSPGESRVPSRAPSKQSNSRAPSKQTSARAPSRQSGLGGGRRERAKALSRQTSREHDLEVSRSKRSSGLLTPKGAGDVESKAGHVAVPKRTTVKSRTYASVGGDLDSACAKACAAAAAADEPVSAPRSGRRKSSLPVSLNVDALQRLRADSRASAHSSSDDGALAAEEVKIRMPKGLPSCEAMLGRRMMRACSVDQSDDSTAASLAQQHQQESRESVSDSLPVIATGVKSLSSVAKHGTGAGESLALAGILPQAPSSGSKRQVKQGEDANDLVRKAIEKLGDVDSDEDVADVTV